MATRKDSDFCVHGIAGIAYVNSLMYTSWEVLFKMKTFIKEASLKDLNCNGTSYDRETVK